MNRDELIRALRTFIRGALVRDRLYVMGLDSFGDIDELSTSLTGLMLHELEHPGYYGRWDCPILLSLYKQILDEAEQLFKPHIWSGGVSGGSGYLHTQLPPVPEEQPAGSVTFHGVTLRRGESLTIALHTAPEPTDSTLSPRSQHLGYPE